MPIYLYECPTCESRHEIVHSIGKLPAEHAIPDGVVLWKSERRNLIEVCCNAHRIPQAMIRIIQPVGIKTIVRGNSDFAQRERERLTRRSNDHWRTKGQADAVERVVAKGLPPSTVPPKDYTEKV